MSNTLSKRFVDGYYINPDFHAKYKIGHELGAGAHGFVLEAQRLNDGKKVAVKFIPVDLGRNWPTHPVYGQVPREVLKMGWMSHDNMVALVDVIKDDSYAYIVSVGFRMSWNHILTNVCRSRNSVGVSGSREMEGEDYFGHTAIAPCMHTSCRTAQ